VFKKILKIFLILAVLAVLAGLCVWLILAKGWPWWVGAALFAGMIGVWIGVLFARRYLLRRKEKVFVQRIIEQDEAAIKIAPVHERQRLLDLQNQWKESIERLSNSHLRKKGNPLYVLPWYLVIGESGAGKTSAIKNARLSSPLTETASTAGITATRNCDWWFFDEAIILDTAGRYTIPVDEGPDKEEWSRFLTLLAKYRRREPLNGVIVTISAEKLLTPVKDELRENGQSIRQRIDHLMRTTGAKFPIYLLITKMDRVHGFFEFCSHFPENAVTQVMGSMNEQLNPYWEEFLSKAWKEITDRFRHHRLIMTNNLARPDPAALFFTSEFEGLEKGLAMFVRAVFEENPFQETPLFRGLYFSSARREGDPLSAFLQNTGIAPEPEDRHPFEHGLFLRDLFKNILPSDRYLFRPIREFLRWRQIVSSQALIAWFMIWLSLCGLMSYSFFQNSITLDRLKTDFVKLPSLTQDTTLDLLKLDRLRLFILEVEKKNKNWWVPRFGLDESKDVERRLKLSYITLFRNDILRQFDTVMSHRAENINEQTPENELVPLVSYTAENINLLVLALQEKEYPRKAEFNAICVKMLTAEYPKLLPEIASKFDELYYAMLAWDENRIRFYETINRHRKILSRILDIRGRNLRWIAGIPMPAVADIRLSDFWGESEEGIYDKQNNIPGAYTTEGRKQILNYLAMLETVLPGRKLDVEKKKEFWLWYEKRFYEFWEKFAGHFNEGLNTRMTPSGWQQTISSMITDRNPYFLLLERMAKELKSLEKTETSPGWAALVSEIDRIRHLSSIQEEKAKGTLAGKMGALQETLKEKMEKTISKDETRIIEKQIKMANAWRDYIKSIEQLVQAATSRETSFRMASDFFQPASKDKDSPFLLARNESFKVRSLFHEKGSTDFVWDLVNGPLDFFLDYTAMEAGCVLQDKWQEDVLGALQGAGQEKASRILFDKTDGVVWKFINNTAQPFLKRSKSGYVARKAIDREILFNPEFLDFLNTASEVVVTRQSEYPVTMSTRPIKTNREARVEPYGSVITLACSDKQISLENYNYPQKQVFPWSPDKCDSLTLKIFVKDTVLTKIYDGPLGFARFLSEFRGGNRKFTADDFPADKDRLKDLGISWIQLSYEYSGKMAAVQLLNAVPTQAPAEIVSCWSR